MNIGFIILHYLDKDVTSQCVNSILELNHNEQIDIHVLIVDNASNNGSGELLQQVYKENKKVNILFLKTSKGFSYGNNCGYKWFNERYVMDFIVVCNNDVVFLQENSIECIIEAYNKTNFFVMGPDIYIPSRKYHDNPHYRKERTKKYVEKRILDMKRKEKYPLGISILKDYLRSNKLFLMYVKYLKKENDYNDKYVEHNVCVSGACLILSKKFIECNGEIFSPETSFYWEEEILFHKCLRNGWNIIYYPFLKVIHNEGTATREKLVNVFQRRKRKLQLNIESAQIFLNYIKSEV